MGGTLVELASRARHDLRSPLTALKGFSSIILSQRDRLAPEQLRQFMEAVCQAGDQIVRLVDSFDVLTRSANGEQVVNCQPTTISTLVHGAIKAWNALDAGREFSVTIPSGLPMVLCDPVRTRLAIDTVIEQAIARARPGIPVRIGVAANDNALHLSVTALGGDVEAGWGSDLGDGQSPPKQGIAMSAAQCIAEAQGGRLLMKDGMFALVLPVQRSRP